MREILFRGKRVDNGEWVEGFFVSQANDTYIFEPLQVNHGIDIGGYLDCCRMQEVIPETVGQYTGLTDKNGKKIFENGYFVIDEQTYKVVFDNAQYILTNIFSCDIILLKDNSNKGVFIDEI